MYALLQIWTKSWGLYALTRPQSAHPWLLHAQTRLHQEKIAQYVQCVSFIKFYLYSQLLQLWFGEKDGKIIVNLFLLPSLPYSFAEAITEVPSSKSSLIIVIYVEPMKMNNFHHICSSMFSPSKMAIDTEKSNT